MGRRMTAWSWLVGAAVGLFVVVLVFSRNLFGRLNAAQDVIGGLMPAFNAERVAGDRAAINEISFVVNTLDPLMTPEGGASADVLKLVQFVSQKSGLTPTDVLSALRANFPHTTGLLTALPLSGVSAEIPKLVQFLSTSLKLSPAQVLAALQQNFPKLTQVITNLPKTTASRRLPCPSAADRWHHRDGLRCRHGGSCAGYAQADDHRRLARGDDRRCRRHGSRARPESFRPAQRWRRPT